MKKTREMEFNSKKKIKRCREDVIYDTVIFIILTLILFIVAYPLWWVIISSISDPAAVSAGKVLWKPIGFTLKGYAEVFEDKQVMTGFVNAIVYTFCGVLVNLAVTLPTAYALSRSKFGGKKVITLFYMVTMFFSGGMIPTYLVVKNMHMLNTMWALILPGCLSVYNMIVARTFFQTNISEELYEAAEIDGCTQGRFFFAIALPLSAAITAILVLYYGVLLRIAVYLRSEQVPVTAGAEKYPDNESECIISGGNDRGGKSCAEREAAAARPDEVLPYHHQLGSCPDTVPFHPEAFRKGRYDRFRKGLIQKFHCCCDGICCLLTGYAV